MFITTGCLAGICLALCIWVVALLRLNHKQSIALREADSQREQTERKWNQDLTDAKILLMQTQEHENVLKGSLDSADRELAALQDINERLQQELQSARHERDEAQEAESILVKKVNRALFKLSQKRALVVILKRELKNEAGDNAEQQVLREYFENETIYLRSILSRLNTELARARTKEARASIIEAFLSHLVGGMAGA